MTRHIMLDIESLGTTPGAPVLSLGAVRFELGDIPPLLKPDIKVAKKYKDPDQFYANMTLKSNMEALLQEVDQGAWDFWMQQDEETRLLLLEHRVTLREALREFWKWVDMEPYDGVWAHGTTFDIPLLAEAYYSAYGQIRVPWRYKAVRDTRTLFSVAYPNERIPTVDIGGAKHNALMDAYAQAKMVQACYERIEQWRR